MIRMATNGRRLRKRFPTGPPALWADVDFGSCHVLIIGKWFVFCRRLEFFEFLSLASCTQVTEFVERAFRAASGAFV